MSGGTMTWSNFGAANQEDFSFCPQPLYLQVDTPTVQLPICASKPPECARGKRLKPQIERRLRMTDSRRRQRLTKLQKRLIVTQVCFAAVSLIGALVLAITDKAGGCAI